VSASWLQFILAVVIVYAVVMAAGYWGKRKRAQQEAQHLDKRNDRSSSPNRRTE